MTILLVAASVYYYKNIRIASDYYSPDVLATHFNGEQFVGSSTCMECHEAIYETHVKTAHFNTSAIANSENIKGSFEPGSNSLELQEVSFELKQEGKSLLQYTTFKNSPLRKPPAKFDIVIGSGVRGQTYLTWADDKLFQLQASYHTQTNSWINSPGYPSNYLERPIRDACLKCHVTFAKNRDFSGQGNQYDKGQMVYGIDCEKCHRPSAKHVIYHRKFPDVKAAKFMMKLDTLTRQQRLDVCAQCHSGSRSILLQGNSFTFLPGENLDEFSRTPYLNGNSMPDVHGDQYGLLKSSKCFKQTEIMDCTTCHDPHKNQRGDSAYFNQKCIGCHSDGRTVCTAEIHEVNKMGNNCIACHMPLTPSQAMKAQLPTDSIETSFYIRTHLIGIYSQELGLEN